MLVTKMLSKVVRNSPQLRPFSSTSTNYAFNSGSSEQNEYIQKELAYGAHNYKPLPVVLSRGQGKTLRGS